MKKSSFIALILGTASGVLFALGMCMALLPEWNAFREGVCLGSAGLFLCLITLLVWHRMKGRKLPRPNRRNILRILYCVIAVLILGVGLCLCLVWQNFVWGTGVGLIGILMLLLLIPMIKGLK